MKRHASWFVVITAILTAGSVIAEDAPASHDVVASSNRIELLRQDLALLEGRVKDAEDNVIEYQRLHDLARTKARAKMETEYIEKLMGKRSALSRKLILLEAKHTRLSSRDEADAASVGEAIKQQHAELNIELEAIEAAEYKWQAKNLMASMRLSEFRRIQAVLARYEATYEEVAQEHHDAVMSQVLQSRRLRSGE